MERKKNIMDENIFLINRGFTYNETQTLPIYARKYYIARFLELENPVT